MLENNNSLSVKIDMQVINTIFKLQQRANFEADFISRCIDRRKDGYGMYNFNYETLPDDKALLDIAYELYLKMEDCNVAYNDTMDLVIDEVERRIAKSEIIPKKPDEARYYILEEPVDPGWFSKEINQDIQAFVDFGTEEFCVEIGRKAYGYVDCSVRIVPELSKVYKMLPETSYTAEQARKHGASDINIVEAVFTGRIGPEAVTTSTVHHEVHSEYYGKWENKGIVFEMFRRWGIDISDHLEMECYPVGKKSQRFLLAKSKRYIDPKDFLLFCEYIFPYE